MQIKSGSRSTGDFGTFTRQLLAFASHLVVTLKTKLEPNSYLPGPLPDNKDKPRIRCTIALATYSEAGSGSGASVAIDGLNPRARTSAGYRPRSDTDTAEPRGPIVFFISGS